MDTPVSRSSRASAIAEIANRFPGQSSRAPAVLESHAHDESWHHSSPPDIVVFPASTDEVSELCRIASKHRLPIVPFGTGSSMEGNVNALDGGVSIDTREMRSVIKVDVVNADCRVEAGVTRLQLAEELRHTGLFFPVDPGADASLGGMAATRASGTMTVRYGSMKDNVMGMTVVLADGRVIRTGGRARKSSSGYDLTRLFVGSEGTLGVITELTLKLSPVPESTTVVRASFPSFETLVDAVHQLCALGVPIARLEYLDELEVSALNNFAAKSLPLLDTLIVETHQAATHQAATLELMEEVLAGLGAEIDVASSPDAKSEIWSIRHALSDAEKGLRPGSHMFVTDVAVPLSSLAELLRAIKEKAGSLGILAPAVGHIGDGNVHVTLLVDRENRGEIDAAERFHDWIVGRSLTLGGTATGEHGIGIGKRKYLLDEHGEGVSVMRAIKAALDPHHLLNPGKLFL